MRTLERDGQLLFQAGHRFKGRPILPFGFGAVFTNITRKQFDQTDLKEVLTEHLCVFKDEMSEGAAFGVAIAAMPVRPGAFAQRSRRRRHPGRYPTGECVHRPAGGIARRRTTVTRGAATRRAFGGQTHSVGRSVRRVFGT